MAHGWAGTVAEFLASGPTSPILTLRESHRELYHEPASEGQVSVWRNELRILREALAQCQDAQGWGLVLEYELPFEGGRRPDVVLLAGDKILVLEFKERALAIPADVDQVRAY